LGGIIREACLQVYGATDRNAALAAVDALGALSLPVGLVAEMKAESVPAPEPLG
jgi:hypothetical protein